MFEGLNGLIVAILSIAFSLLVARFFVKETDSSPIKGRNGSIDGMRGFLALMVFLHHSSIWWQYLHTGNWSNPSSLFYANIGKVAVVFFFMITGFLFFGKLISGNPVKWKDLYWSRFTRLTPMFMVSLLVVFLIVFYLTDWKLRTGISSLLVSMARWIPFTLLGMPDINGLQKTSIIVAGVPWSLVYEWFFYLSLPLIALFLRKDKINIYTTLSFISVICFIAYPALKIHIASFLFGLIAAIINKRKPRLFSNNKHFQNILVAFVLLITCFIIPDPYNLFTITLCGIAFITIANGCTFFGIFTLRTCQVFGESTYSMYLLHGIILFSAIKIVLPIFHVYQPTEWMFSFLTISLSGIITFVSLVCFRYIESPCSKIKLNKLT
ncbi:acyltransferase [Enterobacter hormaechei]